MIEILRKLFRHYFSDPQVIMLGFLLILGFVVVFSLGGMLMPVFISIIIAYLLEGMVSVFQRFRVPRIVAVIVVFSLFMTCLLILILWLLPLLSRQIGQLLQDLWQDAFDGLTYWHDLAKEK